MSKQIYIIKANGEKEFFDNSKLENSLRKAGAGAPVIATIVNKIENELKDGTETIEIYRRAFDLLDKFERGTAAQYSLRHAVLELGPTGFPFENFIGAIFRAKGFETKLRQRIKGLCISYEVDLMARNDEKFIIGEVKFHNKRGIKSDLKVVLYVKERFDDIEKGEFYGNIDRNLKKEKWLITNTKFTTRAIDYGRCCADLMLVSWNYPKQGNLYQLITEAGLYPITCLKTLGRNDKKLFLDRNIVLCRELSQGRERLFNLVGIPAEKRENALEEISNLIPNT
ncbi:MAG: hypothetical protein KAV41_00485 [Candidatus Pacebacteria bacterium]|nr:hypothetical protein [Candidatus Paceibacterota bacterium]